MAKKVKTDNSDQTDTPDVPDVPEVEVEGDLVEDPNKQPAVLKTDGPTLAEWVAAGYPADKYPPEGYAVNTVPTPAEPVVADPNANKATLKAPKNVTGHVTFQGVAIEIKDGLVTVEHFIAKHLREAFGFTDAE